MHGPLCEEALELEPVMEWAYYSIVVEFVEEKVYGGVQRRRPWRSPIWPCPLVYGCQRRLRVWFQLSSRIGSRCLEVGEDFVLRFCLGGSGYVDI